jgi:hypothetical protein
MKVKEDEKKEMMMEVKEKRHKREGLRGDKRSTKEWKVKVKM